MINKLKEKYVNKLKDLEARDINLLVQEKFAEVKAQIEAEVLAKHNEELELARFQISAIDEIIADQEAEELKELEEQEAEAI